MEEHKIIHVDDLAEGSVIKVDGNPALVVSNEGLFDSKGRPIFTTDAGRNNIVYRTDRDNIVTIYPTKEGGGGYMYTYKDFDNSYKELDELLKKYGL